MRHGCGLIAGLIVAQMGWGVGIRRPPNPSDLRPPSHLDDGFAFCRLEYTSDRHEAEGTGWQTDFPRADENFMIRLSEITTAKVDGENHWVARVNDDELFYCPFLVTSDVGTMRLEPGEAARLRAYLLKGGLLWVDDFWGMKSWQQWLREVAKMFPTGTHIQTPDWTHPIYNMQYKIRTTLQVSNLDHWFPTGNVRERGGDSPETPLKILVEDATGRALIIMTHNSDVQDTWEREGDNDQYFRQFSPDGYALGVNVLLYAMTH